MIGRGSPVDAVIIAGNYQEARLWEEAYKVNHFNLRILVPANPDWLRGYQLDSSMIEFVGHWKERKDLRAVIEALIASGMDRGVLWCAMVLGGMRSADAIDLLGDSIVPGVVKSLEEILASLAPASSD